MSRTAGIDVGSTYTKAAVLDEAGALVGTGMVPTGFRLEQAAAAALAAALEAAGTDRDGLAYTATTGYGRNQIGFRDVQATDLTAQSWGTRWFFPGTRTVLDIGGQTMKAMRLDDDRKVRSFRLNDKCAAGTGRGTLTSGAASLAGREERFDRLPGDADTIKAYVRAFAGA